MIAGVDNPNLAILEISVQALGELSESLVFVGGCATGLLVTRIRANQIRATEDVDVVAEVATIAEYQSVEAKLTSQGFKHDTSPDAPICRWVGAGVTLDLMPSQPGVLSFHNRWYPLAVSMASPILLPSGRTIRLIAAPVFIATKLEAFKGRGNGDYLVSHDLEDIVTVVDGGPALVKAPCAHSYPRLCNHNPKLRYHCADHIEDPKHPNRSGADRSRRTSPYLRCELRQPSDRTQGSDWRLHCPIVSAQDETGSSRRLVCACVKRRLNLFRARLYQRQLTTRSGPTVCPLWRSATRRTWLSVPIGCADLAPTRWQATISAVDISICVAYAYFTTRESIEMSTPHKSKPKRGTLKRTTAKSMSTSASRSASIFRNGANQAVRLPQELRFPQDVKEVRIRKQGDNLLISPVRPDWDSFFARKPQAPESFLEPRDDAPPQWREPL